MDIIIILIALIVIALIFKRVDNTIIAFGLIDVFLRIVDFFSRHISFIQKAIGKYVPSSIEAIIEHHATGALETILIWIYVILMMLFWFYVLKMLLHRIH